MIAPPESPRELADARWADIEPHYARLAAQPIDDLEAWLRDWSRFNDILWEAASLANVAYTCDARSHEKEAAHLRFARDIGPHADEQEVRLGRRLLATGQTPPGLETFVRRLRNRDKLFREANVPLKAELQALNSAWQKLAAGLSASWEGREVPLPALRVHQASPDRATRERAYRLHMGAYAGPARRHRGQLRPPVRSAPEDRRQRWPRELSRPRPRRAEPVRLHPGRLRPFP